MARRRGAQWIVPALFAIAAASIGIHAAKQVDHAIADQSARAWLVAAYDVLRTAVSAAFAILTVGRAVPRRPSRSPIAFVACVVAMGTVVAFGDPPLHASNGTVLVGDLLAVLACGWMLTSVLFLGRCFGVLPEARGLVTQGPYGVVRHPVYLGEIGACVGLAIAASTARNAVLLAAFVAAQAIRMRLEERALREAFPEYEAYARKVPRVVPMLRWRAAARDAALAPNRP